MSTTQNTVRTVTPSGEDCQAIVIDRDPIGSFGEQPRNILTVRSRGRTWRVDEDDVETIDSD